VVVAAAVIEVVTVEVSGAVLFVVVEYVTVEAVVLTLVVPVVVDWVLALDTVLVTLAELTVEDSTVAELETGELAVVVAVCVVVEDAATSDVCDALLGLDELGEGESAEVDVEEVAAALLAWREGLTNPQPAKKEVAAAMNNRAEMAAVNLFKKTAKWKRLLFINTYVRTPLAHHAGPKSGLQP
jgi:hypothetical protein